MFSRKETLLKKTGPDGVGRFDFLKQLVTELNTDTTSIAARRQVLANLANFAYDPINFEFIKQLHIIDVFLANLSESDEELVRFSIGGLCNISPDPESRDYIIKLNGIKNISDKLLHKNEEIALDALTTLYYLCFPQNQHLVTQEIIDKVNVYAASPKTRYKNLGTIFANSLQK